MAAGQTAIRIARAGEYEAAVSLPEDFAAVAETARTKGVKVLGPVAQGTWLSRLGIKMRVEGTTRAIAEFLHAMAQYSDRLFVVDTMTVEKPAAAGAATKLAPIKARVSGSAVARPSTWPIDRDRRQDLGSRP